MSAIPLPFATESYKEQSLAYPARPQVPPTAADIVRASKYKDEVKFASGALTYEHALLDAVSPRADPTVAPPWVEEVLRPLKASLAELQTKADKLVRLEGQFNNLVLKTIPHLEGQISKAQRLTRVLAVMTTKLHNHQAGNGAFRAYTQVPFLDGTFPDSHELPVIQNQSDIKLMDPQTMALYLINYYPDTGAEYAALERTSQVDYICRAIGAVMI
ncbi:hypothetical protein B0H12DRAFT_162759 [Mycena haematopus]|nr:hypothetical protein B0H12DRAFT_162759 [Mycena haematopus]